MAVDPTQPSSYAEWPFLHPAAGGSAPSSPLGRDTAGRRAAATLTEWCPTLVGEITRLIPGSSCAIHISATPLPREETPTCRMLPLRANGECLARLVVLDPAGGLYRDAARAALGVLAAVAALRLAQLSARITPAPHDS